MYSCFWLLLLNILYIVACSCGPFILMAEQYNYNQLIHSWVDGHLDSFQFLAFINSAIVNILVRVFW